MEVSVFLLGGTFDKQCLVHVLCHFLWLLLLYWWSWQEVGKEPEKIASNFRYLLAQKIKNAYLVLLNNTMRFLKKVRKKRFFSHAISRPFILVMSFATLSSNSEKLGLISSEIFNFWAKIVKDSEKRKKNFPCFCYHRKFFRTFKFGLQNVCQFDLAWHNNVFHAKFQNLCRGGLVRLQDVLLTAVG